MKTKSNRCSRYFFKYWAYKCVYVYAPSLMLNSVELFLFNYIISFNYSLYGFK